MDVDRIPAAEVAALQSWQPPELGDEQVVYLTKQEGTDTAQFPALVETDSDEQSTLSYPNRQRVTVDELEQLLQDARDDAYQQGFEQGRQDGEQQGRDEALQIASEQANQQLTAALNVVQQVEQQWPQALNLHNQAERALMLQLLEKLVTSVTMAELRLGANNLEAVIDKALASLSDQDQVIEVRVCALDLETLEPFAAEHSWKLVADPNLQSGDCIVESRRALLDYSVQQRIDEAIAALHSQLGE